MEQLELFEELEAQERTKSIHNPILLLRRTVPDAIRLWYLSVLLASAALAGARLLYGRHNSGEEIVFIATPLIFMYLGIRLIRTRIPPAPETEVRNVPRLAMVEILTVLFAIGILV